LLPVQEVRLEIVDLLNLGVNRGLLSRGEPGGRYEEDKEGEHNACGLPVSNHELKLSRANILAPRAIDGNDSCRRHPGITHQVSNQLVENGFGFSAKRVSDRRGIVSGIENVNLRRQFALGILNSGSRREHSN